MVRTARALFEPRQTFFSRAWWVVVSAVLVLSCAQDEPPRSTAPPAPALAPAPASAPPSAPAPAPAAPGSEDEQMVEALRTEMVKLHKQMDMTAISIHRLDDWAWLEAQPHAPGRRDDADRYDPVQGLMRKVNGVWTLADIACTEVDNPGCLGAPDAARLMVANHPGMPEHLVPRPEVRPIFDGLFAGERKGGTLERFVAAAALKPGEDFRLTEIGRDAHSSHHLVILREREPWHRHDRHDLVVFVLRGEGGMMLAGSERFIGPSSVVYVPRATTHAMTNSSAQPMVAYAVFTPPFDGKDRVPVAEPKPEPIE